MARPRKPPPPDPLDEHIRAVLSDRKINDLLLARDLVLVGLFLSRLFIATPRTIADELVKHGFPEPKNLDRLLDRLRQAARASDLIVSQYEEHVGDDAIRFAGPPRHFRKYITDLLEEPRLKSLAPPPPPPPPAPEPISPRAASRKATASTAPAAATPPPPPPSPPPVPAPPAFTAAAPQFKPLDAGVLRALLGRMTDGVAAVADALQAHALSAAQSFEELLSLQSLIGVESHRYQVETVRRVLRVLHGRALLADEVGLGKTIEAIMVLREYQLRGMVRRALVLTPAPLVAQWEGELAAKAGLTARTTDDPLARAEPERFWKPDGVVVASLPFARAARNAPHVQGAAWDLVIVDEAHHVKNRSTLGWKLIDGTRNRFLLLVTATPVENDLEELYNLVTLLRPGQFASPSAFRKEFVDPKDPTSPRNHERLRALLAEVMVRNTRAQSGLKLPPRFVTTVAVEPDPAERELYEAVVEVFQNHTSDETRMATSTLLLEAGSSPQALRGGVSRMLENKKHPKAFAQALKSLAAKAAKVVMTRKGQHLVDLVRAHDGPSLVFTRFRDTLDHLRELLRAAGLAHLAFHGGMDSHERQEVLRAFRRAGGVLLATDVGGEGQNLQFCAHLVNFDLPWNPMLIEQRIGRLHRMGQVEPVRVFNLCAKGTIEERVLDVLDRRANLFELVVGEMDMVLGNLADERDLEERILGLYAQARTEDEIRAGFDALAGEILAARKHYEKSRALDAALFGRDYEA